LSIILFVLELTMTSNGLLAIGGLVAFALGASALYTEPGTPTAPAVEVDTRLIVLMTAITGVVVAGVLWAAWRSHRMPPVMIGVGGMEQDILPAGTPASVRRALTPTGTVYAAGEEWTARSRDGLTLERGTAVRVVGHDGMVIVVEPA
jgi:membrane-bound serine protease (ClpP class)